MSIHRSLSIAVAVALTLASLTSACGANPSDEALLQTNREVRDNLKAPPYDRQVETLNINRAAQLAANRRAIDDAAQQRATRPEDPVPLADPDDTYEPSTDELQAVSMAQDARLRMLNDEPDAARELLEASITLHPTLDALDPLSELLAAGQEDDALAEHCMRTREAMRDDDPRVVEVLRLCHTRHSGDDVDATLSWASPADRDRLRAILAP